MSEDGLARDVLDRLWLRCTGKDGRSIEFSSWLALADELRVEVSATKLKQVVTKQLSPGLVRYITPAKRQLTEDHPRGHRVIVLEPAKDKIIRRLQAGPISILVDGTRLAHLATLFGMPQQFVGVSLAELITEGRVNQAVLPGRKSYETYELSPDEQ